MVYFKAFIVVFIAIGVFKLVEKIVATLVVGAGAAITGDEESLVLMGIAGIISRVVAVIPSYYLLKFLFERFGTPYEMAHNITYCLVGAALILIAISVVSTIIFALKGKK